MFFCIDYLTLCFCNFEEYLRYIFTIISHRKFSGRFFANNSAIIRKLSGRNCRWKVETCFAEYYPRWVLGDEDQQILYCEKIVTVIHFEALNKPEKMFNKDLSFPKYFTWNMVKSLIKYPNVFQNMPQICIFSVKSCSF